MKIIVCFKIVHSEEELIINPDRTINESKASLAISTYDCNAVEAAMRLASSVEGSEVIALTVGDERVENSKNKKGILSRGPGALYSVMDQQLKHADSFMIASCIKAAVDKLGGADLIICGEGSGDEYNQQVGCLVGALYGYPTLNGISSICKDDQGLIVERTTEDGTEKLAVSLPAVLSVTSNICPAKIPSMKDILSAGKKPMTVFSLDDIKNESTSAVETVNILAPESTERKKQIIKGDGEEQIEAFVQMISKSIG